MLRRSTRTSGDRGAALVEMAIVAPLLILLVFGILEFGLAF
jgi:Flp pilus assembly protein TadG